VLITHFMGNALGKRLIIAGPVAEFFVVDFEVGPSARTTDTFNRRDVAPVSEPFVEVGIQPQARLLRSDPIHEAFSLTRCRNVCLFRRGET
jgi:hypothetical protein